MKTGLVMFMLLGLLVRAQLPEVPSGIDHAPFDRLLQRYVDDRGLVDYAGWKANAADVGELEAYLAQFAPEPDIPAEGDERISSLLNAYNAFTLGFILQHYPVESIRLLDSPFEGRRYAVGGQMVSADDLEHGMLRPVIGWKVHALVVCAARSCPPLHTRAFTAEAWEQQMAERYRIWLARQDLNRFDPDGGRKGEVSISRIFRWYAEDYHGENSLQNILERYAPDEFSDFLKIRAYRIRYLPYHWGLNDQGETGEGYRHHPLRSLF